MNKIKIRGTGVFLPGLPINNEVIANRFHLNEEWINYFIGNKYRHYSIDIKSGKEIYSLTDICYEAALKALQTSRISASSIDAIVLATATPDHLMPATVNLIADRLGVNKIPTYQLQSGCAGALQAIDLGIRILNSEKEKNVLIMGGDVCNKFMNLKQDFSKLKSNELINYVLFGDGAGALILTNQISASGVTIELVTNQFTGLGMSPGQVINWAGIIDPATYLNNKMIQEDYKAIENNVPILANELLHELLSQVGWLKDDITYFLPPQLSKVMTDKINSKLNIPIEKTVNCVDRTGNNGNALPFIQLNQIFNDIKPLEKGLIVAIESSKWLKAGMAFYG